MRIVLKIVLFIVCCILAFYVFGAAMVGPESTSSRYGAAFALFIGILWAAEYWPVTLIAVALAIWVVFWWRRKY